MNSSLVFVSGLAVRRLLEELCGTHERANFWAVFSNITVTLVPTIFAMQYEPDSRATLFEVARQVKLGLVAWSLPFCRWDWCSAGLSRCAQTPQRRERQVLASASGQ
jgi:hypothetical protein